MRYSGVRARGPSSLSLLAVVLPHRLDPVGLHHRQAVTGEDVTEHGTGNVGAMNVERTTGSWVWFAVAMFADGSKGSSRRSPRSIWVAWAGSASSTLVLGRGDRPCETIGSRGGRIGLLRADGGGRRLRSSGTTTRSGWRSLKRRFVSDRQGVGHRRAAHYSPTTGATSSRSSLSA